MADLPVTLPATELADRLAPRIDVEGKIPRALESLGPIHDRDVALVDAAQGLRARQLAALGGRVVAIERPGAVDALRAALATAQDAEFARAGRDGSDDDVVDLVQGDVLGSGEPAGAARSRPSAPAGAAEPGAQTGLEAWGNDLVPTVAEGTPDRLPLPDASVDVVVGCWSAFRGPPDAELAEAERVLRSGGRLLVVHDYGRDDVSSLGSAGRPEYSAWSRRDGPYLSRGFRIRVIHCFWTFESLQEADDLLAAMFGAAGHTVALGLRRPRLSYNVAVYHRTKGDGAADR